MKRNALITGAFVAAALALVVVAVLLLGGNNLFQRHVNVMIYFVGNVSGLNVGAPVTFRGVSLGKVEAIAIQVEEKTFDARIAVRVRLQPQLVSFGGQKNSDPLDVPTLVTQGLRARLVAQSFVTGQKAIELDFVEDTRALKLGAPGELEIPALGDRFGPLVEQVADLPLKDTVQDMRDAVKELRTTLVAVQRTLEGTQDVLASANTELKQVGAASRATLQTASAAIKQLEATANGTLASVKQLSDTSRDTVAGLAPDLQRTVKTASEAADAARLAMTRVADLTAPDAALRTDLDGAVRDLSQAARGLRDWSELLEEKPNAIIFGTNRE
ncbi:MlaD family protein [soil metagenome]